MKLLFLMEAGTSFGLGHYMRSRTLAEEAAERGIAADAWIRGDLSLLARRPWIPGVKIYSENQISATQAVLQDRYDWIVVDGYGLIGDASLSDAIRKQGAQSLYFDDLANTPFVADLALNAGSGKLQGYSQTGFQIGKLLSGLRYAQISKSVRQKTWNPSEHPQVNRILISFGGSDRQARTLKIVRMLDTFSVPLDLEVVVGPFASFLPELEAYQGPHRLTIHRDIPSLADLLARADLMICGAGTTVWEACCVGTPFIALKMVDNQEENFKTLGAHQAACLVDDENDFEHLRTLFSKMQDLEIRRHYSSRARALVDGRGAARAIDEMRGRS